MPHSFTGDGFKFDYDSEKHRYYFNPDKVTRGNVTLSNYVALLLGYHPMVKDMQAQERIDKIDELNHYSLPIRSAIADDFVAPYAPCTAADSHGRQFMILRPGNELVQSSIYDALDKAVNDNQIVTVWTKLETKHAKIPPGHYKTPQEIGDVINKTGINEQFKIFLNYDLPSNRFTWTFPVARPSLKKKVLTFEEGADVILGFENEAITQTTTAKHSPDMRRGIYSLFIYCDVCSETVVGNTRVPLLRTVSFPLASFGETISVIYNNPIYIPCMKRTIDSIGIKVCDDSGRLIPFIEGKTLITLHFRRRL